MPTHGGVAADAELRRNQTLELGPRVLTQVAVRPEVGLVAQATPPQAVAQLPAEDDEAVAVRRRHDHATAPGQHASELGEGAGVVGQMLDGVLADDGVERPRREGQVLHVGNDGHHVDP